MPQSQFDLLTLQIAELRGSLEGLIVSLTGDADKVGIYGRVRSLENWRDEHISTHNTTNIERRSNIRDWRRFGMAVGERVIPLIFAAIVAWLLVSGGAVKVTCNPVTAACEVIQR